MTVKMFSLHTVLFMILIYCSLSEILSMGGTTGKFKISERVTMALLHNPDVATESATFGMGCFWGCDSYYGAKVGVIRTKVGYAGGKFKDPTYHNLGDHTEVIQVDFDPKVINYTDILKDFWMNHDPTSRIKPQYTSLILYHSPQQKDIAESTMKAQQKVVRGEIVTRIESAAEFYDAEDYHQKYRLQQHKDLCSELGIKGNLLKTSHVAARLNGYVIGQATEKQFEDEASKLGLTKDTIDYVRKYVIKYQGQGFVC